MTRQYHLGVIGADARTAALARRLAPDSPFAPGPISLRAWAAGPAGDGAFRAAEQAASAGVPYRGDWRAVAHDPSLAAVYVGGPHAGRAVAVAAALEAGKAVVCPLPFALTDADVDRVERAGREGGGALLAPTDLRATVSGREALALVARGELGALHAIYVAARRRVQPRDAAVDVLDELGWEALDFVLGCAGVTPQRVHAAGGRLFGRGDGYDTLVITLRFAGDLIATVELAYSLPAAFPAQQEVEVDLAGAVAAVRVEPYGAAVSVYSVAADPPAQRRPWHPEPVAAMLEELEEALRTGRGDAEAIGRQRALIAAMAVIGRSISSGDAALRV